MLYLCAVLSVLACNKPDGGQQDDTGKKDSTAVVPSVIPVQSVSVDRNSIDLIKGDSTILTATVLPDNATDRSVSWSSSDAAVVEVDSAGTVCAMHPGSAVITVTTTDGGKTAVCSVTVSKKPITGLTEEAAEEAREKVIADWKAGLLSQMKSCLTKRTVTDSSGNKMKFLINVYGKAPEGGHSLWISLHGGGGTTAATNDSQWQNQQKIYQSASPAQPVEGYYLSPRAIADVWNMWFLKENDALFEQLIMTLVVAKNVNPDKIYLMGYSAGGDGLWRMGPRMADHWAAASMMAGHPGGVNLMNLRNTPFMMWVGGEDSAYNRNTEVPKKAKELDELQAQDADGYIHQCTVVAGKPHWMDLEDAAAFPWMAQYVRNPYPKRVVWRQENEEEKVVRQFFYWIKVTPEEMKNGNTVIAEIRDNTIYIEKSDYKTLTFYLNDKMVDLDEEVTVVYDGRTLFSDMVERSEKTLAATMAERNDPSYVFCSEITVKL